MTRTMLPTDFSSSFSGVSRSKSKFCSSTSRGPALDLSSAVCGRIWALTSMKATSFSPLTKEIVRASRTSARSWL